ncbi:hypothetical protein GCM10027613_07330 [Microlunatus endophyticus]
MQPSASAGLTRALDLGTRKFWRLTGRKIDPYGSGRWLRAPQNTGSLVEDSWLPAAADLLGGTVVTDDADAGLLADMAELDGPGFDAGIFIPPSVTSTSTRPATAWRCGRHGRRCSGRRAS